MKCRLKRFKAKRILSNAGLFIMTVAFIFVLFGCKKDDPGKKTTPIDNAGDDTLSGNYDIPYAVWVNGNKLDVHTAQVRVDDDALKAEYGGDYYFSGFELGSTPVTVKIRSFHRKMNDVIIRPESKGINYTLVNDTVITFTIDHPVKVSIEPDGINAPLILFADAPMQNIPDTSDANVIYFGPGVHVPDNEVITLEDNQTLYLAKGAVLKAAVKITGDHTRICGRGILDGSNFIWNQHAYFMVDVRGNYADISGITVTGAATWTFNVQNCHNINIDNIKIMNGKWMNDDGINPVNAQQVHINDCFIRTDDDCIAIKGKTVSRGNAEDITIKNSTLWCNRARIALLGHESRAPYMRNILFENIDVIHYYAGAERYAILLQPGENMHLQDVTFKNIRIHGEGQGGLFWIEPLVNAYMLTKVPGYVSDITFENVSLTGLPGAYKIRIAGADSKHKVEDVEFKNVSVLGKTLNDYSDNFEIGQYVRDISASE